MTAREMILKSIESNQPEFCSLPDFDRSVVLYYEDKYTQLKTVLEMMGAEVIKAKDYDYIETLIANDINDKRMVYNGIQESNFLSDLNYFQLQHLEKAYIKGKYAVAENGAIWITDTETSHRVIPFICLELHLVIEMDTIVDTMHDVYNKISISQEGFGTFIAGPSKTADIEQSLVIGAHGAKKTVVYVIE